VALSEGSRYERRDSIGNSGRFGEYRADLAPNRGSKPDQVDRLIQWLTGSATGTLTMDEMIELSRAYAAEG